jgi:hypothetical protein
MKFTYVTLLVAVAAFGLARADNPPAPAAAGTSATGAAAPASAAAPATPAPAAAKTPPVVKPWHYIARNGKTPYCIEVLRQNSRIPETRCVNEQEYMKELADNERIKQNLMQGANGCQPACAK